MERFAVTLPELHLICAASLRHSLGQELGVTICRRRIADETNWEVVAIDPLPKLSLLADAMEAIAELQMCFMLKDSA